MKRPPTTATDLLGEYASKKAHEFPGAGSDADNAKKYVEALALLVRTCKPHYEIAAQATLMADIGELLKKIRSEIEDSVSDEGNIDAQKVLDDLEQSQYSILRFLNGHGPGHVDVVDKRAYTLIHECGVNLSSYELFFLCASVTIHDAGLVFGRDGHESRIHGILSGLGDTFASKRERDAIERIASAHGGHVPGDKSNRATIDLLNAIEQVEGKEIRPQLIAAIVRLADELAEDHTRFARISGESREEMKARLMGSEAFHIYSRCLEPCVIKGRERVVNLQFLLDLEDVVSTFQKGNGECFILDEIYNRTEKCFAETLYCGDFMQESAKVLAPNEVRVSIDICSDADGFIPLKLDYAHKRRGYPDVTSSGLVSFQAELKRSLLDYAERTDIPRNEAQLLLENGPAGSAVAKLFQRVPAEVT